MSENETRVTEIDFQPMPDPFVAEPEKKREYSSDMDGVEKAAKDLTEAREAGVVPQAEGSYRYLSGDKAGEAVPEHQSLARSVRHAT